MRPLENASARVLWRKQIQGRRSASGGLTGGIYLIFRGLKFEPDADTLVTRSEAKALTISAQLGKRGCFAKVSHFFHDFVCFFKRLIQFFGYCAAGLSHIWPSASAPADNSGNLFYDGSSVKTIRKILCDYSYK